MTTLRFSVPKTTQNAEPFTKPIQAIADQIVVKEFVAQFLAMEEACKAQDTQNNDRRFTL